MAITQAFCNSAKVRLLDGEIDFSADTARSYKIALYTSAATLDASTTTYTTTDEVVGTGYTVGGEPLVIAANPALDGAIAIVDFANVTWVSATFTARGALIYDAGDNGAVGVLDFGQDVTATNGNFELQFPAPAAATAILRIG